MPMQLGRPFILCLVLTAGLTAWTAGCVPGAPASTRGSATASATPEWFGAPCLPDSVDDFGWALHELHGISLRVPAVFRREAVPSVDELHFRRGGSTLSLLLRPDASRIFAGYFESGTRHRYCEGEIAGRLAEAVSFRDGLDYGFAVRWPDAARGEWLSAVVTARTAADATLLRQALLTLQFPGNP